VNGLVLEGGGDVGGLEKAGEPEEFAFVRVERESDCAQRHVHRPLSKTTPSSCEASRVPCCDLSQHEAAAPLLPSVHIQTI